MKNMQFKSRKKNFKKKHRYYHPSKFTLWDILNDESRQVLLFIKKRALENNEKFSQNPKNNEARHSNS